MGPAQLEIKIRKIIASCKTWEQICACSRWLFSIENFLEKRTKRTWWTWDSLVDEKKMQILNQSKETDNKEVIKNV